MKHKITIALAAMFTLSTSLLALPTEANAAPIATASRAVLSPNTAPASNFFCYIWKGCC